MPNQMNFDKTNEPVSSSLEYNLAQMRVLFRMPRNMDMVIRRVTVSDFSTALLFIDGMVSTQTINLHVLEPMLQASPYTGDPTGRVEWLSSAILTTAGVHIREQMDDAVAFLLKGDTIVFVDGCASAIVIDAKGFPKRNVGQPINETVIVGPHEAFVETMKDNIVLVRRILQSPRLVAEQHTLGTMMQTSCSVLYLDGVANEGMLAELRRRLSNLNIDFVMTAGELEQLIEDAPFALFPQLLRTERPDRTASFLVSGMAVIFVDGSPVALSVPATFTHLTHTPELNTMRFPYGSFKGLLITFGLFVSTCLPALYLSVIMFHNEVLPLALITSIFETQSRVPIPMLYELIFLNIGFDLIMEAGARMPGVLSNGLGVVSVLILGQAVVAADLVSPLMIIVVAVCGLGSLIVPEYSMSIGIRMTQALLILVTAVGGLYALLLVGIVLGTELCMMESMGVPFLWPHTPNRMGNPDIFVRYPIWMQRIRHYLSNPGKLFRSIGPMRRWEGGDETDEQ